jgi:2-oxoglutarate ferredoxin oxidoreductase subunit alpha
MAEKVVMQGDEALAEAAIRAGCRFFAGYPITPQSPITEYLSWRLHEVGGDFVQAESELSAIAMVTGASVAGARAMTATSGPGFSLMAEGMSGLAGGRKPAVIVDIQRMGAGGGGISAAQSDYYYATKSLGHGGLKGFVMGPNSVQEAIDCMYDAFDIADKYRTPVIILADAIIGQMMELVELPEFKKEFPDKSEYIPGGCAGREKKIIRDTNFNPQVLERMYKEYTKMYDDWEDTEVRFEEYMLADAEYVIISWGTSARISTTAVSRLRAAGVKVGIFRPITLHPFPYKRISGFDKNKIKGVLTVEMTIPRQFYHDVVRALDRDIRHEWFGHTAGVITTPEEVENAVKNMTS